jgi:PAS domain S-box-containing protein
MLCIAGYDGYFKVLNPSWTRVLGWSEEELLTKPWISYVHPDDVEDTKNVKATLVDGKAVFQFENRYICKDGSVKWLSWNSYPYPEEQIMYGVARDITEKIREEHLRKISYDVAHAVVVSENLEQLVRHIRQKLAPMVETPNFYLAFYNEKTGMLKIPYADDEKDDIYTWPAERSATGLVIKNKQSLLLKKADANKLIEEDVIDMVGTPSESWLGVPLFDESKAIGAIAIQSYDNPDAFDTTTIGIMEFISGQISMALQRKKIIDELVKAKEKAEESDRLKTSFLNNLSHEIRTPLNAIVGFSQFLNEPALSPDRTEHITGVICRSSDQLLSIINDIINISAIESGAVEVSYRKANINIILKQVFERLQHKAEEKGIQLVFKSGLSDADASFVTDETKLTQVLINLVDNAIKYTQAGFVEFRGSVRDGIYQFCIADTGIGIEEHLQNDIFKRFQQVEANSSSAAGGLGLGLPIAKSFVELLGGKIWVESGPGKGTRFFFTIPQKTGVESINQKMDMPTQETAGNKKHAVVLVAEDEETNFELTNVILSTYGVEVLHAWHGQEAVSMCENNPDIDLVLMDIKMPIMNGYEAATRIKEIRPNLPIVALTAYALLGDKEKALNAGCDDYLSKPVSLKDFQHMVEKFLP